MKVADKKKIRGKIMQWRRELRRVNRLGKIAQRQLSLKVRARDRIMKSIEALKQQLKQQGEPE